MPIEFVSGDLFENAHGARAFAHGCNCQGSMGAGLPIVTPEGKTSAPSLAPMAVLPSHQRQGIGSALVRGGLRACRDVGHRIVIVLGHPEFYPRFGFSAKLAERLKSPFSGPAFMAAGLVPGALAGIGGEVRYPPPFGVVT